MPELPEVETIARSLRNPRDLPYSPDVSLDQSPGILGRQVASVEVLWQRTVAEPSSLEFYNALKGQNVVSVTRRGKFLVVELNLGWLLMHLRMSGEVRVEPGNITPAAHDRVLIYFQDGMRLAFNDTRKFGRIWYVQDPGTIMGDLGPEPFDLNPGDPLWREMLLKKNRQIKPLILDQKFLAGLGNIYSDEALHRAGIHPLRCSNDISCEEADLLLRAIQEVLREGILRNGASIDWVYRGGSFQNHFRVYQREGEPCLNCGTIIRRIVVGQRGTHFCPACQK